jgi:glycine cleavage system P protein (glycine dehydrogenase) subunit 1
MRYIPHTDQDVTRMLKVIGVSSVEELFSSIPADSRSTGALNLPSPLSEHELLALLGSLASANQSASAGQVLSFLGAGATAHGIPHALDNIIGRSEFLTAYTPYQAEISQGTLQAVFEFQTLVCELFGLEVANASMYDGATAAAEALLMARRIKRRDRFVISEGLHPEYLETCETILSGLREAELVRVPLGSDGRTDASAVKAALAESPSACLLVQSPNIFGVAEDLAPLADLAHDADALAVAAVTEMVSLSLLEPPGACDFDIAVGEGVGYAVPVSLGGPGVGLFATRDKFKRQMPGRLIGETLDANGIRGYVMTLATREQHIRREKATSNICTNQGLIALCFTIQSSLLGQSGFTQLGHLNFAKAQYARQAVAALDGFELRYDAPGFNEFAVRVPGGDAGAVVDALATDGILPGVAMGRFDPAWKDTLLVTVTELHRREDIDRLVAALAGKGA